MKFGRQFRSRSGFNRTWAIASSLMFLGACAMPTNPGPPPAAQVARPPSAHRDGTHADVLLFAGASIWTSEVDSLANIMIDQHATYQEVNSAELNAMTLDEIAQYALLVVPGGDAPTLTASLTAETHARLRAAVQERGVNYLGFCAGAWAAVAPAPARPGDDVSYGLGIVDGPLESLSYLAKQGKEFAISRASFPDKTQRDLLWYGGPTTPDVPGGVIAKYPDGTPAISQLWSHQGFVIVSGLHPAANAGILNVLGINDAEAIAPEFAWSLLNAGIHAVPLPAF